MYCPRYTIDHYSANEYRISDNLLQCWVMGARDRIVEYYSLQRAQECVDALNDEY